MAEIGRLSPFGILQQDVGLVQRLAGLSAICMFTKSYVTPGFGGTSMAHTDALRNSGYP